MSTTKRIEDAGPSSLALPAHFPITWDHPDDERLFWMHDRAHLPEPITPLDGWSFHQIYQDGINAAAEAYEVPFRGRACRINTYLYLALAPIVAPADELDAQRQRTQEKLGAVMARLGEVWADEFLPEIQRHLAYWVDFDLRGAAMPALLAHLDETVIRHKRLYELHMLIWFPFMTAISLFDELYRDLFGEETAFDAYRLLQGFDNKTLTRDRALWQVSRQALASPEVCQVLTQSRTGDVLATLEALGTPGHAFRAALDAYLQEHGRGISKWELSQPSPLEDPTAVIETLQGYITQPDRDLEAELAAQAAERERAVTQTRARLQGYPQQVVRQFEFLLTAAQDAVVLTEDHGFWIDFRGLYQVRQVFLEFGRRFAEAGIVDRVEDVFFLTPDEVRETAMVLPQRNRRRMVAGRRAEMAYFRTITPPPVLGTLPAGPPLDDPLTQAIGKFFGAPAQPVSERNVLPGTAGSPGKVRGSARVIRSLTEAGKLQRGDVLVSETTAPPWTRLFATAGAVVTATGGILSHCAIVAREYGIPAVVGVGTGTAMIRDGQLLEVDGDAGLVRIVATDAG